MWYEVFERGLQVAEATPGMGTHRDCKCCKLHGK